MNLCKNCRHFKSTSVDKLCRHEKSISRINPIDGDTSYFGARHMRQYECGESGLLFEQKPVRVPLLLRLAYRLSK